MTAENDGTQYRAAFDAAVTFSNGGDLIVHGFITGSVRARHRVRD